MVSAWWLMVSVASAHPLAPVAVTVQPGDPVAVTWRVPAARVGAVGVDVVLPGCDRAGEPVRKVVDEEVLEGTSAWTCGAITAVDVIRPPEVPAVVQGPGAATVVLAPGARTARLDEEGPVWRRWAWLGTEHLATGLDHVLLVASLAWGTRGGRALVGAVTGFTLGHAVSLAAVVLGGASLPSLLVEPAIALTLMGAAWMLWSGSGESPDAPSAPAPWVPALAAGGVGLVHGLGFAGALSDLGLPIGAQGLALASFHVGLELAQLGIVGMALALAGALRWVGVASPARWLSHGVGVAAAWALWRALGV